MKKINYCLFPFIALIIIITSCGKGGAVGPAGSTGAVGPAGPAGANGTNGSVIYSGTITPDATTGANGDFYLDLSTGLLYGPKTVSGWGTGFSLLGASGAPGTAGSKIISGSGAPSIAVGVPGDYYLDRTNYLLYGPKVVIVIGRGGFGGLSWGTPIALQGPAGSQGPMGNANVKVDTFSVASSQWVIGVNPLAGTIPGTSATDYMLSYSRLNNSITQDVMDNGLVLGYFDPLPGATQEIWDALPFQYPISNSFLTTSVYNCNINFLYFTIPGQVTVGFFFSQPAANTALPSLATYNAGINYRFKIVSITGQAGTFMKQNHVNLKNYAEVSKALGLWQQDKLTNNHLH
jgi:hypothetical protein